MAVCGWSCAAPFFILQEKWRHWKSPALWGGWHSALLAPSLPRASAVGKRGALEPGRGQSRDDDISALCYRRKIPTAWDCCCGEPNLLHASIATRDGVFYPQKRVRCSLEEKLRISRYSFCLRPTGCLGLPSCPPGYTTTWGGHRSGVLPSARTRARRKCGLLLGSVTDVSRRERKGIPRQAGERGSDRHRPVPPQPTLPDLPCPVPLAPASRHSPHLCSSTPGAAADGLSRLHPNVPLSEKASPSQERPISPLARHQETRAETLP